MNFLNPSWVHKYFYIFVPHYSILQCLLYKTVNWWIYANKVHMALYVLQHIANSNKNTSLFEMNFFFCYYCLSQTLVVCIISVLLLGSTIVRVSISHWFRTAT